MSKEQDKIFFTNFALIVGALAVMMVIFIILARIIGIDDEVTDRGDDAVYQRTAPIGDVSVAGIVEESETETMPSDGGETMAGTGDKGKEVYGGLCISCHGSGIPGIPQLGDAATWAPRIALGKDTLYKNSLQGFTGKSGMMMPPKGGNPALSDDDIKSAVDYMVANSQ